MWPSNWLTVMSKSFLREPNYLYSVEGYSHHGYWTGTTANRLQALVVVLVPNIVAILFDEKGNLVRVEERAISSETLATANRIGFHEAFRTQGDQEVSAWLGWLGVHESVVKVKRFFLPNYHIGILDFPGFFQEVLQHPSAYSEDEQRVAERERVRWFNEGLFELWLNDATNLWITNTGQIESS